MSSDTSNGYIPSDCAICDSCPRDDWCFLLRSVRLPAFTRKETRTSSSPRDLFFSFPGLLFNSYHLEKKLPLYRDIMNLDFRYIISHTHRTIFCTSCKLYDLIFKLLTLWCAIMCSWQIMMRCRRKKTVKHLLYNLSTLGVSLPVIVKHACMVEGATISSSCEEICCRHLCRPHYMIKIFS
jgi:hypothetical protein